MPLQRILRGWWHGGMGAWRDDRGIMEGWGDGMGGWGDGMGMGGWVMPQNLKLI